MNKIPLSNTGLFDPFTFDNYNCRRDFSSLPSKSNNKITYGKIGKNQILDRMKFFFNSDKNEKYQYTICEIPISCIF